MIVGMMYKIIPFLVWHHRYSDLVGLRPVPPATQFLGEAVPRVGFWLLHAGIEVTVGGLILESSVGIQAGTIGDKGEIFVLNMGKPVRIVDLARELIRLSGHEDGDIEIQYTGLRPGEKLSDEILVDEEKAKATRFEKIFIAPPLENCNDLIRKSKSSSGGPVGRDREIVRV
jgi:hypothetical protein